MELKWRYPDKYKDCIVMFGIFHMIMMYLGIIGKKFSDAGLKDLVVQSDVVATGSADKALSGKMYKRSVRAHKLVYEALYRCLLNRMEDNKFEQFNNAVTDHKLYLESTPNLAKFWLSYLSMVELLLNTLYATCTSD